MIETKIASIIALIGVVWLVVKLIKGSGRVEEERDQAVDSLESTRSVSEMARKEMEKHYERKAKYRGNMSRFLSDLRSRLRR